jgi:hypothetical protein
LPFGNNPTGLLPKRQKLNWSGITPQKANNKPEWEYPPKRQKINWSGIPLQMAKNKLEWDYSPKVILLQFNFCLLGSNPTPV